LLERTKGKLCVTQLVPESPRQGVQLVQSGAESTTPENLRAVCTNCNEGLQNIAPSKLDCIELNQTGLARRDRKSDASSRLAGKKYAPETK
jgi:hypothetical protein